MSVKAIAAGSVRGFLHDPGKAASGLVITHGAGGNCEMPLLVAVAAAFEAAGIAVLRCDLMFRQKGRTPSPSSAPADRAGLADEVQWLRARFSGPIYLGGQSYGGRQASMLAAEEPDIAAALLLLSYPLHPPGKPDQLRTQHFASLKVPALFVHGTKDPFGSPEEMLAAIELIPAPHVRSEVPGAGHDLKRGKFDVPTLVLQPLLKLADRPVRGRPPRA